MGRKLPVLNEPASSIRSDGSRNYVHPADVTGRFLTVRRVVYAVLIVFYLLMPFLKLGGRPLVFLDVAHRRFFFFGTTATAHDFWLSVFLLTGLGFLLFFVTTLWGRIWCGYACPHSVFLEGVYRPIERFIEGPRSVRMRRNAAPMSFDKLWRKFVKHLAFFVVSLGISHVVLSLFTSLPAAVDMVLTGPAEHLEAFLWVAVTTLIIYGNFAFFREQLCLVVCPYGRLQSSLIDDDSLVIGYDETRGEPRGKLRDPEAGDCIDCKRCVVVCPTGLDIRNGLQMECIGCAQCIDACDEVMDKVGRERGLVRYDSLNGFAGKKRRVWRPRVFFYIAAGLVGLAVSTFAFTSRTSYEANLQRVGAPFVVRDGQIYNTLTLQLSNKEDELVTYQLEPADADSGLTYQVAREIELPSLASERLTIIVTRGEDDGPADGRREHVRLRITDSLSETPRVVEVPFVAPR